MRGAALSLRSQGPVSSPLSRCSQLCAGHVFYSSADRAIYPLRVTAGLFDDTIALRDVHWLDRRIQQPPDAAKLAKVGAPQDLVWETVPGSAIPTHGAQLRSDEQQHLNNVWAAHVAAANEAAR